MLCSAHNQSVLFLTLVHIFRGFSKTSFHNQSSYYSPTGTDSRLCLLIYHSRDLFLPSHSGCFSTCSHSFFGVFVFVVVVLTSLMFPPYEWTYCLCAVFLSSLGNCYLFSDSSHPDLIQCWSGNLDIAFTSSSATSLVKNMTNFSEWISKSDIND